MKVRATQKGYYGEVMREVGEVFNLLPRIETDRRGKFVRNISADEQFSHEWMERVDGGPVPPQKKLMPDDVLPPPPPPTALKKPTTPPPGVPPTYEPSAPAVDAPTGSQEVL